MNHYDIPPAYRYNAEALGDDPRRWGFVRNTNLPRDTFADPLEWMTRRAVRWGVIALLVACVITLIAVHADVDDEQITSAAQVRR